MNKYIFEDQQSDQELHRLRLIEQALDGESIGRLQCTGVTQAWRCLELGAGAGSIAQWLGGIVGSTGLVMAVDKNTQHIQHLSGAPYRIVQGNFLDVELDGDFDLAHCRYVLIHNPQSQSMLAKLVSLLRPGGCLVVEEPDFTSAKLINPNGDPTQQHVNDAICQMFEQMELDPAFGLTLPQKIAAMGLEILRVDSRIHLHRGGDTMARMMGHSTNALRDKYVATGKCDESDIDAYIEHSMDPNFWAVYYSTAAVVAIRSRLR